MLSVAVDFIRQADSRQSPETIKKHETVTFLAPESS